VTNKELQEALAELPDDLHVELTRIITFDTQAPEPEPSLIRLDYPIIGLATKDGDLVLVVNDGGDKGREFLRTLGESRPLGDS